MHLQAAILGLGLAAAPAPEAPVAETLVAGTQGVWRGELQYRDYQSNQWVGLPVTVEIAAQRDGVTTVRTASYDDGPEAGIVTITTVSLIDAKTASESYAGFRKGHPVDTGTAHIDRVEPGADARQRTIVTSARRIDGNALADIRETTTRDGDRLTTLKEVRPDGAATDGWQPRNRTVLNLITATPAAR